MKILLLLLILLQVRVNGALDSSMTVMLPTSCTELLQKTEPFIDFFEAIGRGVAKTDRELSKRIFAILVLREKLKESSVIRDKNNPVDVVIQKALCFYREQKEPLKEVSYDNPQLLIFIKQSISELEKKVQDTIFEYELERFRRKYYELKLEQNNKFTKTLRLEAEKIAESKYKSISERAKKKVFSQ